MFAMNGLISKRLVSGFDTDELAKEAYEMADSMLEARKPKEVGIKTVKRTRKLND
jgi:hypothetical protein